MTKKSKAKATPASKPIKAAVPGTLPATIANALPSAMQAMKHMAAFEQVVPFIAKDLEKAKNGGAIHLARAFVALHRMEKRIDEALKPLFGKDQLFERYKTHEIPALFEAEGITNVPLAEGYRVGISSRFLASIRPDQRDAAYDWLRANGLADIIQPTVNAGTLSAALKKELEDNNKEAPGDLFNVALVPNTSVTTTEKK